MATEALVLSSANLQGIEQNLEYFSKNLGEVTINVNKISSKVEAVTKNVLTLEEEIKKMMLEIKGTTILSSAKQSVVISQNEWQKNFSQNDLLRKNILGLIQATDMGLVRKSSLDNLQNEVLFNTPDYWLAPAIVAISGWLSDQREIAEKGLNEALRRDKLKTSLLLTLVYLRVGRHDTATKWLNYYLNELDSNSLDNLIIVILNSFSDQAFNNEQQKKVIDFFENNLRKLDSLGTYKQENIDNWIRTIKSFEQDIDINEFFTINKYTEENEYFSKHIRDIKTKENFYNYLLSIINKSDSQSYDKKKSLDKLTNLVVNEYSGKELELKKDIFRNTLIISENGDVEKAQKKLLESELVLQEKNNLYNHLFNCVVDSNNYINPTSNTVKMALSFQKDNILSAYKYYFQKDNDVNYIVNYTIDGYKGSIKDGYDEMEEKKKIESYWKEKQAVESKKIPIINLKMLIAFIIMMITLYLLKDNFAFILIDLIFCLSFIVYEGYINNTKNKALKIVINKKINDYYLILEDLISEIIQFKEMVQENDYDEKTIGILNNINYRNYLVNNEERMIIMGETK